MLNQRALIKIDISENRRLEAANEFAIWKWESLIRILTKHKNYDLFDEHIADTCGYCVEATTLYRNDSNIQKAIHDCDICKVNHEICNDKGFVGIIITIEENNRLELSLKILELLKERRKEYE